MSENLYRVDVTDCNEEKGSFHTDSFLPTAVYNAVARSGTYTKQALIIGLIAEAILDEIFTGEDERRLVEFCANVRYPTIVKRHVEYALQNFKERTAE